MWAPYLNVIRKKAKNALNILDRFHIMKTFNETIDTIRREEAKQLSLHSKEHILTHSRGPLLKNKETMTENQAVKLKDLLRDNLRVMEGYLMRKDFQRFWHFRYIGWAEKFLDAWIKWTMYSKLEPKKKVAKTLRNHKHKGLILNCFRRRREGF